MTLDPGASPPCGDRAIRYYENGGAVFIPLLSLARPAVGACRRNYSGKRYQNRAGSFSIKIYSVTLEVGSIILPI
jgi:hypothetical protein